MMAYVIVEQDGFYDAYDSKKFVLLKEGQRLIKVKECFAGPCQNPRKRPHTKRFGGITTDLCKCLLIKKREK